VYREVCLTGPDAVKPPVVDVTLHIIGSAGVFYAINGIHKKKIGILQMYLGGLLMSFGPIPQLLHSLQQYHELPHQLLHLCNSALICVCVYVSIRPTPSTASSMQQCLELCVCVCVY
jgi:hypothetical protein